MLAVSSWLATKKINVLEYYPSKGGPMISNLVSKYSLENYVSVTSTGIPKKILTMI